jgi:hypothetical protein
MIIKNKNAINDRIATLKRKKRDLQDRLLNDEITEETFQKKKSHIARFLEEAEDELRQIEKSLKNVK